MKKQLTITSLLIFITCSVFAQLHLLNDEFDNASTLSNWLNINDTEGWGAEQLEAHDINTTEAGHLMMMPYTSSWYQDYRGTLLYKEVSGDFVFTTEVEASNRAGNGLPSSTYSLAGMMLRTPKNFPNDALTDWVGGQEDYVFLSVGYASTSHNSCNGTPCPQFEVKNTNNSNSSLSVSLISSLRVKIRMARIGDAILVLYQLPGEDFVVHRRYSRSDFPETVQVGFVTYTDWPKVNTYSYFDQNSNVLNANLNPDPSSNPGLAFNPDLIGIYDFARFDEVTVPVTLAGVNLVTQASDADLLSFLDYPSEPAIACAIPTGNTETVISGKVVKIEWDAATGARRYRLRYRPVGGSWTERLTAGTETFRFFNDLSLNTTYEYQIKTLCDNSNAAWSSSSIFTTNDQDCDFPSSSSIMVQGATSALATWASTPDDVKYRLRYKQIPSGTWTDVIVNTTSKMIDLLNTGATYKYSLKTKCAGGWTNWSANSEFMTPINFNFSLTTKSTNSIHLFPNPTQDEVQIALGNARLKSLELYNVNGHLLYATNRFIDRLDLFAFPKGMYFVRILGSDGKRYTERIVKVDGQE